MSSITYRPDIDGLRALAVIAVVLFHINGGFVPGGYVGVDIFFVISGFLITSIILKDLSQGHFSFTGFWERRVRRILPALVSVVVACLLAGWFFLLPIDYENLGKQILSQSVFASNVLFYLQSGYFDSANETKPLLHTWSLAVEEQFYIFFPGFLFFIWKFAKKHLLICFFITLALSFAFSVYAVSTHPSFAFYMLPCRAWELLIGGIIAVFLSYKGAAVLPMGRRTGAFLSVAGVLCIAVSMAFYTDKTPFPGVAALLPCIGAGALIVSGACNARFDPVYKILSMPPFIFLGKISYSWYLWHWPIIVFYKYLFFDALDFYEGTFLFFVSLFCAWLSWKFIESPFRKRSAPPSLRPILLAAAGLTGISVVAYGIYSAKGHELRFDSSVRVYARAAEEKNEHQKDCNRVSLERISSGALCETLPKGPGIPAPSFLLWGDSHADAVAPAFYELSERHRVNGYIGTYDGCPPLLNVFQKNRGADFYCTEFNKGIFNFIKDRGIRNVFLVAAWTNWMENPSLYSLHDGAGAKPQINATNRDVVEALENTVRELSHAGINIYVLHTVPTAKFDPPRVLAIHAMNILEKKEAPYIDHHGYREKRKAEDTALVSVMRIPNVYILDAEKILCPDNRCLVSYNNRSLYYNGGHLSRFGAIFISSVFSPVMKEIAANNKKS